MKFEVISIASFDVEDPACSRFVLYAQHVRPVLEERSSELED